MTTKLYNAIIIASDSKNRNKVRFTNDLTNRITILQRDNFNITFTKQFDRAMTKNELLDQISDNEVSDDDFAAIQSSYDTMKRINISKTSVDDVFSAILSRKEVSTDNEMSV